MVQSFKSVHSKWKLLNEQYFPVKLFAVRYISNYDSEQNPTMWLSQGGTRDFKRRGWSNEGKNQNPKNFQGFQQPPPPQSVKFSSLKNSQKALKTQKEIPLIFPTQLNQKFQTQKNPLIIPVSRNPEYPHCGDYTSKLFLVAFSLGESGGSRLQKSGGVNSPTSLLS